MNGKHLGMATLISVVLLTVVVAPTSVQQGVGDYDPWADINDDGKIDIKDIATVARKFGTSGEPFAAKAALEYDSGWLDITDKSGQYFNVTHNLNSTDIMVDITGKTTLDGGAHQRHLGLIIMGYTPGWNRSYDRSSSLDRAYSMVQTSDGGYAIAGETYFGAPRYDYDFYLVKTDSVGNMEWNQTYGRPYPYHENAFSLIQTTDGGYAIAGYTYLGGINWDFWLIKTDSSGNMQWNKTYGGYHDDKAHSVVQTSDGGYAIAGYTASFAAYGGDFWLIKTDSVGNMQWNKTYNKDQYDIAHSMVQTFDGGYAIAGYTGSQLITDSYDFWLVKTYASGNMQWNKTYGGVGDDYGYHMVQTNDLGYAIAGWTKSFGFGNKDFWLVKIDASGNMQWHTSYGGTNDEEGRSLIQTSDGGYAVAGWTTSFGAGMYDFWLVKTSVKTGGESGLAWTDSTANTITVYRGATDVYWNYVRVRIWKIKETP